MFNNLSVGIKLKIGFFVAVTIPLIAATIFTIIHFGKTIEEEALKKIRSAMQAAELVLQSEAQKLRSYTLSLANDQSLKVLFELDLRNKFGQEIGKRMLENHVDILMIADIQGKIIARGNETKRGAKSFYDNSILRRFFFSKKDSITFEPIPTRFLLREGLKLKGKVDLKKKTQIGLVNIRPMIVNGKIVAVVIAIRVLALNPDLVQILQGQVGEEIDVAIFTADGDLINASLAGSTNGSDEQPVDYTNIKASATVLEEVRTDGTAGFIDISRGGYIARYGSLKGAPNKHTAVLMVGKSADSYAESRLISMASFGAIAFFGWIFAFIIQVLIERQIVTPIKLVRSGTETIAKGNYDYNIIVKSQDEIGTLARSFNSMAQQLKTTYMQLADYNTSLEEKVQERTGALQESNERMLVALEQVEETLELLNPGVSSLISKNKQTLGLVDATEFICDLSGYTKLNMILGEKLMGELMTLFYRKTHVLLAEYHGFRDKIVGDQIVATFGIAKDYHPPSPLHPFDAVFFAVNTINVMDEINDKLKDMIHSNYAEISNRVSALPEGFVSDGLDGVRFSLRCGINTSNSTTGKEIDQLRMVMMGAETGEDYTGQGGALIYAARLESSGSPGEIHIGENTMFAVNHVFITEELPTIVLKGLGEQRRYKVKGLHSIFEPMSPKSLLRQTYEGAIPEEIKIAYARIRVGTMQIQEVRKISNEFDVSLSYLEHVAGVFNVMLSRAMFSWAIATELGYNREEKVSLIYASMLFEQEKLLKQKDIALKLLSKDSVTEQVLDFMDVEEVDNARLNAQKEHPNTQEGEVIALSSHFDYLVFDRTYSKARRNDIIFVEEAIRHLRKQGIYSELTLSALEKLMVVQNAPTKKSIDSHTQTQQVPIREYDVLLHRGSFQEAIHKLTDFVKKDPHSAIHWYYLGVAARKAGDSKLSEVALWKAMETSERFYLEAAINLGKALRSNNKFEDARKVFERIRKEAPDSGIGLYEYARLALFEGDHKKLSVLANQLRELDSHLHRALLGHYPKPENTDTAEGHDTDS